MVLTGRVGQAIGGVLRLVLGHELALAEVWTRVPDSPPGAGGLGLGDTAGSDQAGGRRDPLLCAVRSAASQIVDRS